MSAYSFPISSRSDLLLSTGCASLTLLFRSTHEWISIHFSCKVDSRTCRKFHLTGTLWCVRIPDKVSPNQFCYQGLACKTPNVGQGTKFWKCDYFGFSPMFRWTFCTWRGRDGIFWIEAGWCPIWSRSLKSLFRLSRLQSTLTSCRACKLNLNLIKLLYPWLSIWVLKV